MEADTGEEAPETLHLTLPHSRTLAYSILGSEDALNSTVFYCHSSPGSQHEALLFHPAALRCRVRLIAASRPGVGESSPLASTGHGHEPGENAPSEPGGSNGNADSLVSWPSDVLALADHLRIQRFGLLGVGNGSAFVLACLKQIPAERLVAAAVVGGVYPTTELSAGGGAGKKLGARLRMAAAPYLASWTVSRGLVGKLAGVKASEEASLAAAGNPGPSLPQLLTTHFATLCAPDRELWQQQRQQQQPQDPDSTLLHTSLTLSLRTLLHSPTGLVTATHEATLLAPTVRPWPIALSSVRAERGRLAIWHGALDAEVSGAVARKAAEALGTGIECRVVEEEGRWSVVVRRAEDVVGWLKEMVGAKP